MSAVTGICNDVHALVNERGWRVLPCRAKSEGEYPAKSPWVKNWINAATTDHRQIEKWWAKRPDSMAGVLTGKANGIIVLDLDEHTEGVSGLESLKAYCREQGTEFPVTLTAETPSGGLHLYFIKPDVEITGTVGILPGVDVRSDGNQVIVPPSYNPKARRRYKWRDRKAPIAPLPPSFLELLTKPKEQKPMPPMNGGQAAARTFTNGGTPYGKKAFDFGVLKESWGNRLGFGLPLRDEGRKERFCTGTGRELRKP